MLPGLASRGRGRKCARARGGRGALEQELAVGAVEVDLSFEHPGEGLREGEDAAGVGLAVVGLRPLENLAVVRGAANLKRLAVEVLAARGWHFP